MLDDDLALCVIREAVVLEDWTLIELGEAVNVYLTCLEPHSTQRLEANLNKHWVKDDLQIAWRDLTPCLNV